MKSILLGFALVLIPSLASAQLKLEPPKDKVTAPPPVNVLIQHEWIQLSNKQASILLFGEKLDRPGAEIRKEVETLIAEKKAKIVNRSTLLAYNGGTVRTETILHDIYPTEYDPPESRSSKLFPPTPTAYEERPVGLVTEVEATVSPDHKYIDLCQEPEWVTKHKNIVWRTFKHKDKQNDISMPSFTKLTIKHVIPLKDSSTTLTGMFSAISKDGKVLHGAKVLHFTTAIIVQNK